MPIVEQQGAAFTAIVREASIVCIVTREALQEHFAVSEIEGAPNAGVLDAKWRRIEAVARGKIIDGAFEPDGSVMLRSADFWI
jgi:uncharacterized protein DUF1488